MVKRTVWSIVLLAVVAFPVCVVGLSNNISCSPIYLHDHLVVLPSHASLPHAGHSTGAVVHHAESTAYIGSHLSGHHGFGHPLHHPHAHHRA